MRDFADKPQENDAKSELTREQKQTIAAAMQGKESGPGSADSDSKPIEPKPDAQSSPKSVGGEGKEPSDWSEWQHVEMPVADLPWPKDENGELMIDKEDYHHHKMSYDETEQIIDQYGEIKPLVEQGYTSEDFARLDKGYKYPDGYQNAYDIFYGDRRRIEILKIDDQYEIDKGQHLVFMAKYKGLDTLPVHLKEKLR